MWSKGKTLEESGLATSFLPDFPLIRKPFLRTLAACLLSASEPNAWEITVRNRFRRGARFIADARHHCHPLDRNERARIIFRAEALERSTRPAGGRNGVLGYVGLTVLEALLWRFHRAKDGMCAPSYLDIMAATGLCKQSVANALKRLEAAGFLDIMRRLVREAVDGVVHTRQGSNLYRFKMPAASVVDRLVAMVGEPRVRAFPKPAFGALARLLGWEKRGGSRNHVPHSLMSGRVLSDGVY